MSENQSHAVEGRWYPWYPAGSEWGLVKLSTKKEKKKNVHIITEPHLILMNHIQCLLATVLAFKGQGAHNNKVLSCRYCGLEFAHMVTWHIYSSHRLYGNQQPRLYFLIGSEDEKLWHVSSSFSLQVKAKSNSLWHCSKWINVMGRGAVSLWHLIKGLCDRGDHLRVALHSGKKKKKIFRELTSIKPIHSPCIRINTPFYSVTISTTECFTVCKAVWTSIISWFFQQQKLEEQKKKD